MFYYKWFLRNVYPSVNAAYYFSILAFNLAYLFDNTKYSSPFLWLIRTRIRRLGPADHRAITMATQAKPGSDLDSRHGSDLLGIMSPQNIYPQLLSSLRFFLPASIFALKFLEWWHASDFSRQLARKATEALDLPAPVVAGMTDPSHKQSQTSTSPTLSSSNLKSVMKSSSFHRRQPPISSTSLLPIFTVPLPTPDSGNESGCPICHNPLTNPTACQTGYVFCYSCVFRWINGDHERQIDFMNGEDGGAAWEDEYGGDDNDAGDDKDAENQAAAKSDTTTGKGANKSREGKWESGKGRCPVTGRRVLGGTDCLRRVLV
jgi:peroxin-12